LQEFLPQPASFIQLTERGKQKKIDRRTQNWKRKEKKNGISVFTEKKKGL
jgi:hypothetical protein